MQGFQFEVIHKPGKIHTNADSLSRREYEEANMTKQEDPDDLRLGPEVCTVHEEERREVREYKLHYQVAELAKVSGIFCQEPADSLSAMIHAIDTYEELDPLQHMTEVSAVTTEDLRKEQREDSNFQPIMTYLEENQVPENRNETNKIVAEAQYYII